LKEITFGNPLKKTVFRGRGSDRFSPYYNRVSCVNESGL
jgi:hypothetical protein